MSERRCETCLWWKEIVRNKGICTEMPYQIKPTRPNDTCNEWSEDEKRDGEQSQAVPVLRV